MTSKLQVTRLWELLLARRQYSHARNDGPKAPQVPRAANLRERSREDREAAAARVALRTNALLL